jgi:hypothetical protein
MSAQIEAIAMLAAFFLPGIGLVLGAGLVYGLLYGLGYLAALATISWLALRTGR